MNLPDSRLVSFQFTDREKEIVKLLVENGYRNSTMAEKLFVCEKTVKYHLTNIYKKTKITNRVELIVKFRDMLPAK